MLKKDEKASGAELEGPSTDSVYDFLYYDVRRVGSFLSQFEPYGVPQQSTATDTASKDVKSAYSLKFSGSLPIPGTMDSAEGGVTLGKNPGSAGSEQLARVYDPLWINAITLLDYLSERDLIKRDLGSAGFGQIVLATGDLTLIDTQTLSKLFTLPSIREMLNAKSPPAKGQKSTPGDAVVEIFTVLPSSLQARMTSLGRSIWGCLREDSFVGLPSDLLLKHGAGITGTWSILGILDAKPDQGADMNIGGTDIAQHIPTEGLIAVLRLLGPFARAVLGRPNGAFGITPLLIFRDVG